MQTKDAFYFPHFSNARKDRKIQRLIMKHGLNGYAIYFMLLEVLREESEFIYPLKDLEILAFDFRVETSLIESIIREFELFDYDDEYFYSPKMVAYLAPYISERKARRIDGIKGNLIKYKHLTKEQANALSSEELIALNDSLKGDLSGGESPIYSGGDRKESKVNESKREEKKESVNAPAPAPAPAREIQENFFEPTKENLHHLKQQGLMKGISEDEIDAFILNMNGNGWTYTRANNVYPFKDLQQVFLKMWDWKTTGILTDRVKKIKKAALNGSYTNTPEQVNGERFEVIETPNGWDFKQMEPN